MSLSQSRSSKSAPEGGTIIYMPPENYEPGQKSRASVKHDIYRYRDCFSFSGNIRLSSQMFQHFIMRFQRPQWLIFIKLNILLQVISALYKDMKMYILSYQKCSQVFSALVKHGETVVHNIQSWLFIHCSGLTEISKLLNLLGMFLFKSSLMFIYGWILCTLN